MSGWKVDYEAHIAKGVHFLLAVAKKLASRWNEPVLAVVARGRCLIAVSLYNSD